MKRSIMIETPFRNRIPALSPDERAGLLDQIRTNGCLDPLVLWGDTLLDGHHRLDICAELGVNYDTVQLDPPPSDDAEAMAWIDAHQLGRRNLTPDHLAVLRGRLYNRRKSLQGRPKKTCQNDRFSAPAVGTAEAVAVESGVSSATVNRDARLISELERDAPEEIAAVMAREKTLREIRKERRARNKPAKPEPRLEPEEPPEGIGEDHEPDPMVEWERCEAENEQLRDKIALLEKDDAKAEISKLQNQLVRLSANLHQVTRTGNEAQKQAKSNGLLLQKIRKALGVETNSEILPYVRELRRRRQPGDEG